MQVFDLSLRRIAVEASSHDHPNRSLCPIQWLDSELLKEVWTYVQQCSRELPDFFVYARVVPCMYVTFGCIFVVRCM